MIDSVELGDTIYVPVKIDRIFFPKDKEKSAYCGGLLTCFQPANGERQKILLYFDADYILNKCRVESSAIVYTCGYGKDKEE